MGHRLARPVALGADLGGGGNESRRAALGGRRGGRRIPHRQCGSGFLLSSNANQFNSAGTFAAVVVLAAMSFTLDRLMFLVTKRALIWKEANQSG